MIKTLLVIFVLLSFDAFTQNNGSLTLNKRSMYLVIQEGDSIGVTIKNYDGELSTSGALKIINKDTIVVGGKGIVVAEIVKILAPPTTKRKVSGVIKTAIGLLFVTVGIYGVVDANRVDDGLAAGASAGVGVMALLVGTPFLITGAVKLFVFKPYRLKSWGLTINP